MTTPEPGPGDPDYPPPDDPYAPVDYPDLPADYPYPPPAYPPPPADPPGYPSSPPTGYPRPSYPSYPAPPYADPYDPYRQQFAARSATNGLAIGSLATSIVGAVLALICCAGGIVPLAGIVLGIVALTQINKTDQDGKGMAIAGIVIGALALVVTTAIVLFAISSGRLY
jgi:Domain of unknown function (DUF4190)